MSFQIEITPKAEADIEQCALWYKSKLIGLDTRFLNEMEDLLRHILLFPLSKQIRFDNTRLAFLKDFPFGVHHLVEENKVIVLRVLHTSRNPKNWTKNT